MISLDSICYLLKGNYEGGTGCGCILQRALCLDFAASGFSVAQICRGQG